MDYIKVNSVNTDLWIGQYVRYTPHNMLNIPQQNPLKYDFSGVEVYLNSWMDAELATYLLSDLYWYGRYYKCLAIMVKRWNEWKNKRKAKLVICIPLAKLFFSILFYIASQIATSVTTIAIYSQPFVGLG